MADQPASTRITTTLDERTASASGIVDASPAEVFDFIRRPANHAEISGDRTVRDRRRGPELLGPESRFGMKMRHGVPYRITSRVVEFDEGRVIAWCHFGGHRWRWELEPAGDGATKLTETFDGTTSRLPIVLRLMGLPKGHVPNVEQSVANVQAHFRRASGFCGAGGTGEAGEAGERTVGTPTAPAGAGDDRVEYDEFGYFADNASEYGIAYGGQPDVRRVFVDVAPDRRVSALVWGSSPPEVVLIHGGAQNAHTWDTVALALGRPLVAVDLPGHGHSDGVAIEPGESRPEGMARDVATAIERLAPEARIVVGMSLGGLTSIALTAHRPDLVRKLVLVDITPGVDHEKAKDIVDFVRGPQTFPNFAELLARTTEFNPTRTESSLRRGILHNAVQLDDGSWMWRYRRHADPMASDTEIDASSRLWDTLEAVAVPVLLARGMRSQSVVDDADEAEFLRRVPHGRVEHFDEAGHSIQGDMPVELAASLTAFADES